MSIPINLLVLLTLFSTCQVENKNLISVNIPTAALEAEYVWRTIQDIKFFEENNYEVSLPDGQLIEKLIDKSKEGKLSDEDYNRLEIYVQDSVFRKSDYLKGYEKVINEVALINKMIHEINESNFNWEFRKFDSYEINLTLYGPGGSYNPDEGSILLFTTPDGAFKSYENPANTIIHEITHIGMEESIINKFEIPHALKERMVDMFVTLNFKKYLPNYRVQNMGDKRIDQYLKSKGDLKGLSKFAERIMKEDR